MGQGQTGKILPVHAAVLGQVQIFMESILPVLEAVLDRDLKSVTRRKLHQEKAMDKK